MLKNDSYFTETVKGREKREVYPRLIVVCGREPNQAVISSGDKVKIMMIPGHGSTNRYRGPHRYLQAVILDPTLYTSSSGGADLTR